MVKRQTSLPIADEVSLQTVGRRVDSLSEEEYLENKIVSPQDVPRDLIIGYALTEKGHDAMETKRGEILEDILQYELFSDTDEPSGIKTEALATLIADEFGLDNPVPNTVQHYSRNELLAFLGSYLLQKKTAEGFGEKDMERFQNILNEQQNPRSMLQ